MVLLKLTQSSGTEPILCILPFVTTAKADVGVKCELALTLTESEDCHLLIPDSLVCLPSGNGLNPQSPV